MTEYEIRDLCNRFFDAYQAPAWDTWLFYFTARHF